MLPRCMYFPCDILVLHTNSDQGMSLAQCAAAYTLTGSLISETATYPTASASPSSPASVSGYGTTTTVLNTYTTSTSCSSSTTPGTVIYTTPHSNVTYSTLTTTTSSLPSQFTGGAAHLGFPALALAAAGAVLVL